MKKLNLSTAEKLLQLRNGERLQASKLLQAIFQELLAENILYKTGKTRGLLLLVNSGQFDLYLQNRYAIADLNEYVTLLRQENYSRSDLVRVSTDSKLSAIRSFKGFLVNCYEPVDVMLNHSKTILQPLPGLFHFIYDYENFIPDSQCTIVGVENPENFRYIEKQKKIFQHLKPLFISRYPQGQHADIIRWLKMIPNPYLHFGDFDLAGINIYQNEFKKYIPEKSTFFIPDHMEELIRIYGNPSRYDDQKLHLDKAGILEEEVVELIRIIHKHKKGLDQEIFQNFGNNDQP